MAFQPLLHFGQRLALHFELGFQPGELALGVLSGGQCNPVLHGLPDRREVRARLGEETISARSANAGDCARRQDVLAGNGGAVYTYKQALKDRDFVSVSLRRTF